MSEELKDIVGKTVSGVTEPWEGECEADEVRIQFSDGTEERFFASDSSAPPLAAVSIEVVVSKLGAAQAAGGGQ